MADQGFLGFGTLSRPIIRKYIEKENTLARHTFTSGNLTNDKESDNDISSPLLIRFHKKENQL